MSPLLLWKPNVLLRGDVGGSGDAGGCSVPEEEEAEDVIADDADGCPTS